MSTKAHGFLVKSMGDIELLTARVRKAHKLALRMQKVSEIRSGLLQRGRAKLAKKIRKLVARKGRYEASVLRALEDYQRASAKSQASGEKQSRRAR